MAALQLFRGIVVPLLLITFAFGYPSQAQYSDDFSSHPFRAFTGNVFPKSSQNIVKHGLSKLNSTVSFGIHESDIAAIFRGVAYGTTGRPQMQTSRIETPTTAKVSTTSTTTTTVPSTTSTVKSTSSSTTTTTQTPISSTSSYLIENEPSKNWHQYLNSSVSPSTNNQQNVADNNGHMFQDSAYRPSEINIPTPSNVHSYQQFEHDNRLLESNFNSHMTYKSAENVHLRESEENVYGRRRLDDNKIEIKDIEVQPVVDYAWVIHVYLTGVLMGVVAAMAICCISRIHFCAEFFPRKFYVTMHVLVFLAAFLRCILLFNGSFGEANSKLPKVLTGLLINSVPPFLTAAFALVLLVFLNGTNLNVVPTKYQSSFVLAVISIVHVVSSVTVDICAGLSDSESVINALRAGVQAITAGWGILLCLGFISLIAHLWKNEDKRASIPKISLPVIYVAVGVELILACFTIYGIVTPRATKNVDNDNTWSLWVLASCERFLEACFCVTLLVITTTFTIDRCNNTKPQEQRGYTGKREGVLKKSANVYPVTSDKGGFLPNAIFGRNLEVDSGPKSNENIYSGWLDTKYAGTIDSTISEFQLLAGKSNSTMSTVVYPHFGTITTGDSGDDSVKDSYISHGPESSATSYSTLSSYRQMNPNHLCYCGPVAQYCPTQNVPTAGFPNITKQPVLLISQYSNPQANPSAVPLSEESSSGSSYYGSSLGSSHIYSAPQYYTCPSHVPDVAEVHMTNQPMPGHLHQCSEIPNAMQARGDDNSRHITTASLPILQDIPEMNKRILQYRPQQPLPASQEMHFIATQNGTQQMLQRQQQFAASPSQHHPTAHPMHPIHTHHVHPSHIQQSNLLPPQHQQHTVSPTTPPPSTSSKNPAINIITQASAAVSPRVDTSNVDPQNLAQSVNVPRVSTPRASSEQHHPSNPAIHPNHHPSNPPPAIHSIQGSDCSFLNKLVKSPEGQILSGSLELDTKRLSTRRSSGRPDQTTGIPIGPSYKQHMALNDEHLPSQIV